MNHNHEQSYTEMLKSSALQKHLGKETFILELYADMMLQEAILKTEKDTLLKKIDDALDQRDRKLFMDYSFQLLELNKRFGN
ncbi:MAG: IDEAL domain-containing protein [Bacillus sp. (in: firmicutes)]